MNGHPEWLWSSLVLILVLAPFLAGLFNAAEVALSAVSRRQMRQWGEQGMGDALRVEKLLSLSPRFLAAFMLGKTLLLVAAGLGVMWLLEALALDLNRRIGILVLLVMLLAISQVAGRAWALRDATRHALGLSRVAQIVSGGLAPLVFLLLRLADRVQGERHGEDSKTFLSEEGLRFLIELHDEETEIKESEKRMMARVVELRDTLVREVMVPRIDVIAVSLDMSLPQALDIILEAGHSRVPVYADNIDSVEGILYAKDILKLYRENSLQVPLAKVAREPYFVPASKKVDAMLREFQGNHIHIAIVVDEFGGTAGLVTIEDLIEEIFGEIQDEYDQEQPDLTRIADDLYEFDARCDLDDAARILDVKLPVDMADTMGGFIFSQLGRVPVQDDQVQFGDWRFQVIRIESSRIKTVQAQRMVQQPTTP